MLQVIEFFDHDDDGIPNRFRVVGHVEIDDDTSRGISARGERFPWPKWSRRVFLPWERDKPLLGAEALELLSAKDRALIL